MAIDTESKRRSAAQAIVLSCYAVPDGTVDPADRPQVTWLYSGITISLPGGAVLPGDIDVLFEDTPILTGWHPTLPIQEVKFGNRSYYLNGLDRPIVYDGSNTRQAFILPHHTAPTATLAAGTVSGTRIYGFAYVDENGYESGMSPSLTQEMTYLNYSAKIGSQGTGNDNFNTPQGIDSDGTHVYVADRVNDRIKKHLLSDMSYVAKIGSKGTGNDGFDQPVGITVDGSSVYVCDQFNHRIHKRAVSDLAYQDEFGVKTESSTPFNGSSDFITGGDVTLATTGDFTVEARIKIPANDSEEVIASKRDDAAANNTGWELRVKSTGEIEFYIADGDSTTTVASTGTVDDDAFHHVEVNADRDGNAVIYIDGVADGTGDISGEGDTLENAIDMLVGAVVNGAGKGSYYGPGNIDYVAVWNTLRHSIDFTAPGADPYEGNESGLLWYSKNEQYDRPRGITDDGTYLYITDMGNHRVVKRAISGLTHDTHFGERGVGGSGTTNLNYPQGCAVQGNYVYVCDTMNHRIVVLDKVNMTYVTSSGSLGTAVGQFNQPQGCASDGSYLYVGDSFNNGVVRMDLMDAGLGHVERIGSAGSGNAEFSWPTYPAVNGANFLITDTGNDRISKHTMGGQQATVTVTYSPDAKVSFIRPYGSKLAGDAHLYKLGDDIANVTGTGTTTFVDTNADSALGVQAPVTQKREYAYGKVPAARVGAHWARRLWFAGAVNVGDSSPGTASLTDGSFVVAGTGTTWTDRMEGRKFTDGSANEYTIAYVASTTSLWLTTAATETVDSTYSISDTRDPNYLYYSPPDLPEDFPEEYFLPIGEGDGDEITAIWASRETLYVFKRRSIWKVDGSSQDTWEVRQIATGIGCDSQQSMQIVNAEGGEFVLFWCWPRIYVFDGFSQPVPVSVPMDEEFREAERMPSYRACATHDREQHLYLINIAPEGAVETEACFAYDYMMKSWMPMDGFRGSSIGVYRNRYGNDFLFLGDEFGSLQWLFNGTTGDVAVAGTTSGSVTAYDGDLLKVTDSAASFTDTYESSPVHMIDASGNYYENRAISITGTTFVLARPVLNSSGTELTPDTNWTYLLGGYRTFWQTGLDAFSDGNLGDLTEYEKNWNDLWLEHETTSATLLVDAAVDSNSFSDAGSLDLSADGPAHVALRDDTGDYRGTAIRFLWEIYAPGEVKIQGWKARGTAKKEHYE